MFIFSNKCMSSLMPIFAIDDIDLANLYYSDGTRPCKKCRCDCVVDKIRCASKDTNTLMRRLEDCCSTTYTHLLVAEWMIHARILRALSRDMSHCDVTQQMSATRASVCMHSGSYDDCPLAHFLSRNTELYTALSILWQNGFDVLEMFD